MNVIGKIVVCFISFVTAVNGAVKGELPEFETVKFERGILVLTTHKTGWRMAGEIGDHGVWKTLPADSDIDIPLGERSGFALSRHQSISFTPLAEGKGLVFLRQTNLLSFGKGLKEESFSINIGSDGSITYGDVIVNNLTSDDVVKNSAVREATQEAEGKGFSHQAPPAEEKPTGTEPTAPPDQGVPSLAQASPETKSTTEAVTGEVTNQNNRKLFWIIGFSGLAALILLLWVIKKASK